ncbi:MAG: redoxin domain-containing protein [Blastocatellia bacterium]
MNQTKVFRVLLCGALLTLCMAGGYAQSTTLTIGQAAPDFTLRELKGKEISLKSMRGKPVIVGFFSTECPIVNAYHERIRLLAAMYEKQGVTLLGVFSNVNEPLETVRAKAAQQRYKFPVLWDENHAVADLYAARSTPEMFLVDGEGVLRYHGRIDNSPEPARVKQHDLRRALDEVLAGKTVTVTETRAFGCAIKRTGAAAPKGRVANSAAGPQVSLLTPAAATKLLEEAKGSVLVVNFWATWCGPCVAEFPEFVRLDQKYRARGVRVVGINADEPGELKSKIVPFVRKQKAAFEIYVQDVNDPDDMIRLFSKQWSGELPATFVYDRSGKQIDFTSGLIDRASITKTIEAALKP